MAHHYVDLPLFAITNHPDETICFLRIEGLDLFLLFPVIQRTNGDDNKDGHNDSNAFNPIHDGLPFRAGCTEVLEKAKGKRYDGGNR